MRRRTLQARRCIWKESNAAALLPRKQELGRYRLRPAVRAAQAAMPAAHATTHAIGSTGAASPVEARPFSVPSAFGPSSAGDCPPEGENRASSATSPITGAA